MSYQNHFQHHRELIYALEHQQQQQSPFDQQLIEIATGRTADQEPGKLEQSQSFSNVITGPSQVQDNNQKQLIQQHLSNQCSISIPRTTASATSASHVPSQAFLTPMNQNPLSAGSAQRTDGGVPQGNFLSKDVYNSGNRPSLVDQDFNAGSFKHFKGGFCQTPQNWIPYQQVSVMEALPYTQGQHRQSLSPLYQINSSTQQIQPQNNSSSQSFSQNGQLSAGFGAQSALSSVRVHQLAQQQAINSTNADAYMAALQQNLLMQQHQQRQQQQFQQQMQTQYDSQSMLNGSQIMKRPQSVPHQVIMMGQNHHHHQHPQIIQQQQQQAQNNVIQIQNENGKANNRSQSSQLAKATGGGGPRHFIFPNSPINVTDKQQQNLLNSQDKERAAARGVVVNDQFNNAPVIFDYLDPQKGATSSTHNRKPPVLNIASANHERDDKNYVSNSEATPQKQSQIAMQSDQKANARLDKALLNQSLDERGFTDDKSAILKEASQVQNNQSTDVERNGNLSALLAVPATESELMRTGTPQRSWLCKNLGHMESRDGNSSYTTDRRESHHSKKQQAAEVLRQGVSQSSNSNIMRLDLQSVMNLDQNNMVVEQSHNQMAEQDGLLFVNQNNHSSNLGNNNVTISSAIRGSVRQQNIELLAQPTSSSQSRQDQSKTVRSTPGQLHANRFVNQTNRLSSKSRQNDTNNQVTPTLTLSHSLENKTMQTQQFLNTTIMNTQYQRDQTLRGSNHAGGQMLIQRAQDKSENDLVFLTSDKTFYSDNSNALNINVINSKGSSRRQACYKGLNNQQTTSQPNSLRPNDGGQTEQTMPEKQKCKLQEIEPNQAVSHLLNKSVHSDEFQKLLFNEIQQISAFKDALAYNEEAKISKKEVRAEPDEDLLGCNLGTHISTQRSSENDKLAAVLSNVSMSPGHNRACMGGQEIKTKTMAQNLTPDKQNYEGTFVTLTPQQPQHQNQGNLLNHMPPGKVEDQLTPMAFDESCNEGFLPDENQQQATNSMESYSGRDSTSSSLSIYQRFPDLPKQLREIVELQNFRIKNVQVEVDTLKEQNQLLKANQVGQDSIQQQVIDLAAQNEMLKQVLFDQQRQHNHEIDQICSQFGPMMEALKLLTHTDTVDLNQTELMADSSKAGLELANAVNQNDVNRIQKSLGGLLSKSLAQLKNRPGLTNSYSLTNSRFQLRGLQSARSNLVENEKSAAKMFVNKVDQDNNESPDQISSARQQQPQQIIVTSARRVTKIIQTTTSQHIIESEIGPEQMRSDFDGPLSIVHSESQERFPTPIGQSYTKKQGRTEAYFCQGKNLYLGAEQESQEIENFTDDGNVEIQDEADIPISARRVSSILKTPVFNKTSKIQIDFRNHQRALSWNHNAAAARNQARADTQLINSCSDSSKRDASEAMSRKNPFTSKQWKMNSLRSVNDSIAQQLQFSQDMLSDSGPESPTETGVTQINIKFNDIKIDEQKTSPYNRRQFHCSGTKPPQGNKKIAATACIGNSKTMIMKSLDFAPKSREPYHQQNHQFTLSERMMLKRGQQPQHQSSGNVVEVTNQVDASADGRIKDEKNATLRNLQGQLSSGSDEVLLFKPDTTEFTQNQFSQYRSAGSTANMEQIENVHSLSNQPLSRKVKELAFDYNFQNQPAEKRHHSLSMIQQQPSKTSNFVLAAQNVNFPNDKQLRLTQLLGSRTKTATTNIGTNQEKINNQRFYQTQTIKVNHNNKMM